ncbi:CPBP family intramembrane glutamic endopeptidase [Krasilnikoviella flava]|uniref:CAAX protease self-immunity n=1 Tax=Krasilnikoviella flava TaxID=526729 RepID=A0A1T5KA49_9MICO|nr:CPBP family intramembrane glutamic endopeptidase [Krasilnikoviella flava]SKC60490.1 CAAX protease self-immunity [Krasilnikoviella flava]
MVGTPVTSRWRGFWERGGLWRALLVTVVYLALYLLAGLLVGTWFGDLVDTDDIFATPLSVFLGLAAPLLVGAVVLTVFLVSLRWFPVLFARQALPGRGWMWVAPALVLVPIVLRALGIDYATYAPGVVATALAAGLLVGFVEEVLCRGIVVTMLRRGGWSEWAVMVVSSLVFALLHSANILSGMPLGTVALTVVYTFGFGTAMYLTLRVTRNLVWPILLHGLFDPLLFLSTGGIDEVSGGATTNTLVTLAGPTNLLFVALGIVGLFLARAVNARRTGQDTPLPASA